MSNALAVPSARESLARVVSDVFSPPALAIPALILGVWVSQGSGNFKFAVLYFLVAVVVPVLYVVWALRTGRISDFHMSLRSERVGTFIVSIASALVAMGLLVYLNAPNEIIAPIMALVVQTVLLFLISLTWQVSVHTATAASLVTFGCLALGPVAATFAWLVPLVAWARVHLGRHTVAQTLAGAGLGVSCFAVLFALRGIAW